MKITQLRRVLLATATCTVLSACGANDIASPGTGGNVTITNNTTTPAPTPAPTPTPPALVTPAAGCPTITDAAGLTDSGTITNPAVGTFRVCTLPRTFTRSSTLPKLTGLVYRINGRVDVGTDQGPTTTGTTNVVLTIEAGSVLYGESGPSWLAVNRGNSIQAVGTATRPIIFTSRDNIQGLNGTNSSGQWGGIVLLGRGQVTDCAVPTATPGTTACERQTEGAVDPALFGGANNTESSGRMSYVQIRYSGFILSANSELQALTLSGVGSGTQLDHIMSYNSSDDSMEIFGGRPHLSHYVAIGAEDDGLDTDTGAKTSLQYGIVIQRSTVGDSIIEADSDNALDGNLPRQNTRLANYVFRQNSISSNQAAMLLRGGTDYGIYNSVVVSSAQPCLRISRAQTASTTQDAALDEFGAPQFRGVLMQCGSTKYVGSGVTADAVAAIFGTGANGNNDGYTPSLTSLYINGATETAVTPFDVTTLNGQTFAGNTLTRAGFFQATTYIGAVKDAADTWYQGWTCNSDTANLGASNSSCLSIPTT